MKRTIEINGKKYCRDIVMEYYNWRSSLYPSWYALEQTKQYWKILNKAEKIRNLQIWFKEWSNFAPIFW